MASLHALDTVIGATMPPLTTDADLRRFEATPYERRIAAQSTYDALRLGAARDPDAPALSFLAKADPDEEPRTLSHAQLLAGVTRTANLFTDLGIGPHDVVRF